jgi:hypothetical protein
VPVGKRNELRADNPAASVGHGFVDQLHYGRRQNGPAPSVLSSLITATPPHWRLDANFSMSSRRIPIVVAYLLKEPVVFLGNVATNTDRIQAVTAFLPAFPRRYRSTLPLQISST